MYNIGLVIMGILLLGQSLFMHRGGTHLVQGRHPWKQRGMLWLQVFFIFGYSAFAYWLITDTQPVSLHFLETIVSVLFFCGAIFVSLTMTLIHATVRSLAQEKEAVERLQMEGTELARHKEAELEKKVFEHTEELSKKLVELENSKKAVMNLFEDIKESEEQSRKQADELKKFQQAADKSFDQTVITDADGVILYANHATEAATGYSMKEIIGAKPSLWGKQMPLKFYETLWRTIKTEKQSYAGELTNRRKDGTKYLASARISSILDENNEVKFFVGVVRDITEERKSQLKIVRHAAELERANTFIAEEKERAESILRFLKSIGEGVFATDEKHQVIFMNESAELMAGKAFEEARKDLVSKSFVFIHKGHAGPRQLEIVAEALERKKTVTFPDKTFIIQGKDEIPVSGTCSLIRDENQAIIGTITVFQDITKKHELDQMKDSFLSVAAHQLRTPLGSMRWSMELLLGGDLGKLPKDAKEAMQQIYDNSQRMIMLVNDLLDVERMDQNKGREEKKPMDIALILEEVLKTMRPEAEKRGVTVSFKKQKPSFPAIIVPPKHFYEALENLISNSIKYNKKDGTVNVFLGEEQDGLLITITDTGIGIPKGAQSKIFSKFFRAENAVLKETEGSGLGLSVVKSYLGEAGAVIRFESEENVGSTFFIQLPFKSIGS